MKVSNEWWIYCFRNGYSAPKVQLCLAFCPASYSIRNTFVCFCYLLHTKFLWNESKYELMPIFRFIEEFFSFWRNWSRLYLVLETSGEWNCMQISSHPDVFTSCWQDDWPCVLLRNFELKVSGISIEDKQRVKLWPYGKILSTFSHVVIVTGSLPSLVQMVSK